MNLVFITDSVDAAVGMRLAGIESTIVRGSEEAENAIRKKAADENVGIIIVPKNISDDCIDVIGSIRKSAHTPLIVTLP